MSNVPLVLAKVPREFFAATPVAVGSLERNSSSLQCYNFTEAYIHFQTKSLIATIKLKPSQMQEPN